MRAFLLFALALILGCADAEAPSPLRPAPTATPTWTVVVYGNGDNDLSDALDTRIAEMSRATLGDDIDVVVVADRDDRAHPERDPQGSTWLAIRGDGADPALIRREPERRFDDPEVLRDVVARAFTEHPSKRRALILWGHGGGWKPGFGGDRFDDALLPGAAKPMSVDDLEGALAAALADASVAKLDLLGFDACLMGGVETAYALRDLAGVMIASAEIDYGAGWDYQGFLSRLTADPDADTNDVARAEVALWDARHGATLDDRMLRAQAAVDLGAMDALAAATRAFTAAAIAHADTIGVLFAKAAFFAMPGYGGDVGKAREATLHDLRLLARTVSLRPELAGVSTEAAALVDAIDAAVIARALGDLRAGQGGLNIGLPTADDPASFLPAYRSRASRWDGASGWSDLVEAVGAHADSTPPVVTVSASLDGAPSPDHPAIFDVVSADLDIVGALAVVVRIEPNGVPTRLGLASLTPLAPGVHGALRWDGRLHALASPSGTQPTSSALWLFGLGAPAGVAPSVLLAIPGKITAPGALDRPAAALFAKDHDEAVSLVVSFDGFSRALSPSDVTAAIPGASFVPLLDVGVGLDPASADPLAGDPIPLANGAPLTHAIFDAPPAKYAIAVVAIDVWRNVSVTMTDLP